jgi:hypothetical protein
VRRVIKIGEDENGTIKKVLMALSTFDKILRH